LQFLNNNRLNKEEKHGFPQETHVFRKTCSITNRVIEQVHYIPDACGDNAGNHDWKNKHCRK
ncbi:MAG: hypothetical protein LBH51_08310, partial [Treponema sp.]|nr:hypothetical protein [Treponema sp.]